MLCNIENFENEISKLKDFNFEYTLISNSIDDTYKISKIISKNLDKFNIINLNGELGAGKTAFMQGIAKYFKNEDHVSSPTFTIVNEYDLKDNKKIFHFDVYRLEDSDEFLECIGTDYFENGFCIFEWGNIIRDILPKSTLNIDISKDDSDDNTRIFKIWR